MKISDGVIQVTRPEWTVPTPGRLTIPPPRPTPNTSSTSGTPPPSGAPASPGAPQSPTAPWSEGGSRPSGGSQPPAPGTAPTPDTPPPWGWAAPLRASSLTLEGTAPGWLAPTTAAAAWSVNVNPDNPQPDRLRPTALTPATSPAAGLSWLTTELVADLNPWGETGTPSTGP
ncbi:hypothetical protein G3I17_38980 [Streptomyces sp. SID13031]|nr:hypothetical protein [Streptomyces sp. SID13031]